MNRQPQRTIALLLSAAAMTALGACAQTGGTSGMAAGPIAALSPLELVGLTVQSADGTRTLGNVDDLVLTTDNHIQQAIITTGAPMYPTERKVMIDAADLRYAPNQQALILVGLSPTQFAALPASDAGDHMLSLGTTTGPALRNGLEPTNWTGATVPR